MNSILAPRDEYTVTKKVKINYVPHLGQSIFHASPARFRIVCCGRKWGKTTMLVMEAFRWLGRPDTLVWWVAPYHSVAQLGWRRFKENIPPVTIASQDRREARIDMINGSQIWFKSADNPDGLVGEGIDLLIMDEAARVSQKTWEETLYPNLDDPSRMGHMAAVSTPKGHNWFYTEWLKGINGVDNREGWGQQLTKLPITNEPVHDVIGGWPSWNSDYFRLQNLQEALGLPQLVFMQEYAARFLSDLGSVFQDITKAVHRSRSFEEPRTGEQYYMGVDLGKVNDYTVLTIIDSSGHVVHWDRFKTLNWPAQVKRIVDTADHYNEATILIDSTGLGDPVYDFIRLRYRHVQAFKITNPRKRDLIDNLAIAISSNRISYPHIQELMEELQLFGVEQTSSGNIRYQAPRGFHDDCVISLALATWLKYKLTSKKLSFTFYEWG